jgi:hypothetical protein
MIFQNSSCKFRVFTVSFPAGINTSLDSFYFVTGHNQLTTCTEGYSELSKRLVYEIYLRQWTILVVVLCQSLWQTFRKSFILSLSSWFTR